MGNNCLGSNHVANKTDKESVEINNSSSSSKITTTTTIRAILLRSQQLPTCVIKRKFVKLLLRFKVQLKCCLLQIQFDSISHKIMLNFCRRQKCKKENNNNNKSKKKFNFSNLKRYNSYYQFNLANWFWIYGPVLNIYVCRSCGHNNNNNCCNFTNTTTVAIAANKIDNSLMASIAATAAESGIEAPRSTTSAAIFATRYIYFLAYLVEPLKNLKEKKKHLR